MKQIGFFLFGIGAVLFLLEFFSISSQGVWWEISIPYLLAHSHLFGYQKMKIYVKLGLHWRIAIIFAIVSPLS